LSSDDFRANNPRFVGGNFEQNMGIVRAVEMVARGSRRNAGPGGASERAPSSSGGALRGHVQDQPV